MLDWPVGPGLVLVVAVVGVTVEGVADVGVGLSPVASPVAVLVLVADVGLGLGLATGPVVPGLVDVPALLVLVLCVQEVSVYERLGCGTICTCARHYCAVVIVGGPPPALDWLAGSCLAGRLSGRLSSMLAGRCHPPRARRPSCDPLVILSLLQRSSFIAPLSLQTAPSRVLSLSLGFLSCFTASLSL